MEQVRAFVAIELPARLKSELREWQARLKDTAPLPVKWVDPAGIHLTLKFLGNVPTSRIGDIIGALAEAATDVPSFRLVVEEPGVFPNAQRPQVAWVGLGGELERLAQLHRNIETNLSRLSFTPETRAFTPHLTLARLRDGAAPEERRRFGEAFLGTRLDSHYVIEVAEIVLMKSQLTPRGAVYSRLGGAALGGKVK